VQSVAGSRCSIRIAGDACIEGSLATPLPVGARVTVSVRPERVQIGASGHTIPAAAGRRLAGTLREVIYLGDHVRARVAPAGATTISPSSGPSTNRTSCPAIGEAVELAWAPEHCRAFAREDEVL
jgi:putative spermidine/putrescine transport system ATP-binding protein